MRKNTSRLMQRLEDLQHDAVWMIQHGFEEGKTFEEIVTYLNKLNARINRLKKLILRVS